jgi:hypothetical protein
MRPQSENGSPTQARRPTLSCPIRASSYPVHSGDRPNIRLLASGGKGVAALREGAFCEVYEVGRYPMHQDCLRPCQERSFRFCALSRLVSWNLSVKGHLSHVKPE